MQGLFAVWAFSSFDEGAVDPDIHRWREETLVRGEHKVHAVYRGQFFVFLWPLLLLLPWELVGEVPG